jgi:hypothetical protein
MRIEDKAGDRMFTDYAGDRLSLILPDGRLKGVEVFAASPGCSQLTCVEAASQKKEDPVRATENALHYFGGVPRATVPDSLKPAVTRAGRYEAVLNEDFFPFAGHCGVTVYPARICRPGDRAPVENTVKPACKDIYTGAEPLRRAGTVSLNRAIASAPEEHSSQPFTLKSRSRRQYFEEVEKQALSLLNPLRYPVKKQVMATVMKDARVRPGEDMHCYPVPCTRTGKKVRIVYSLEKAEIYEGYRLTAVHCRCRTPFQPATGVSSLHPGHRHILEASPGKFIEAAAPIHPRAEGYIRLLREIL